VIVLLIVFSDLPTKCHCRTVPGVQFKI